MDVQQVILVTEKDEAVGTMEKMEAHRRGLLHRAFSVFIFDTEGKMLLQQRAQEKYHGAGLWTNACCSHPFPGEPVEIAAARRLGEELGFSTPLQKIFSFVYHAPVENGLIEHEYDHVFSGRYEGLVHPNPAEVSTFGFKSMDDIKDWITREPAAFTSWFKIAFPEIQKWWQQEFAAMGGR
jgi:isopentenyl-diphosphate Delta-isomerase